MSAAVPEPVREIILAMTSRAVARCAQEGIALEDFYRVLLVEHEQHPKASVTELFTNAFRRLKEPQEDQS